MGRPKLPNGEIKSIFKQVRVTKGDEKFMKKFGISPTKLFREALDKKKQK